MALLQPRSNFNDKIKNVLFLCQYKDNPIKLVGSSSIQSQKYFGDYDALTAINKNENYKNVYTEFENIISKINNDPDLYFIELKIQTKNKKFKYYKDDKLNLKIIKDNFYDIEYLKIDLSMWYDYQFIDVSIIYQLFSDSLTKDGLIDNLKDEIKDLQKDGKYYKILKRKFSIYKIQGDENKMSELTKIFNSDLGLQYKIASNIEAMELVYQHYKDKITIERIKINLDFLKINKNKFKDLENEAKKMKNEINKEAKKLNENFEI